MTCSWTGTAINPPQIIISDLKRDVTVFIDIIFHIISIPNLTTIIHLTIIISCWGALSLTLLCALSFMLWNEVITKSCD